MQKLERLVWLLQFRKQYVLLRQQGKGSYKRIGRLFQMERNDLIVLTLELKI